MNIITDIFASPYQFWLVFGGILLMIELLGAAGYALWSGVAALIVAIVVAIIPLNWPLQWILFTVLGIVVAILWWKWLQLKSTKQSRSELLNRPYIALIGRQCTLVEPIKNGYGRAKLADGSWRVKSDKDLPVGTTVTIEKVESNTLIVKEFLG